MTKVVKNKITFSFLLLVAAEVIFSFSGYILSIGLGRILGVEDYGRFSIIASIATIVSILAARGVPTAMVKRISEHPNNWTRTFTLKAQAFKIQAVIVAVVTAIFLVSASFMARGLGDPSLVSYLYPATLIIPAFALSSFHVQFFNAIKAFKATAALKAARGIFRLGTILPLAFFFGITGAIWGFVLAPLLTFLLALLLHRISVLPQIQNSPQTQTSLTPPPYRDLLTLGGMFFVYTLCYELYMRMDLFIIKYFIADDTVVGLYAAAQNISLIPYQIAFALTYILFPTISTLAKQNDYPQIRTTLHKIMGILIAVLTPSVIALVSLREFILTLFYGDSFSAAAVYLPYLAIGSAGLTGLFILISILNGMGQVRLSVSVLLVAIMSSLTANMFLVPLYGALVVSQVFAVTSLLSFFVAFVMTQLKLSQSENKLNY